MTDTLLKTIRAKASQGSNEAEISFRGEADLHQHYINCQKNPDHSKFITFDNFNVNCLPEGYQVDELVKCILAHSRLVVRVAVTYTSHGRPAVFSGTDIPYPFVNQQGSEMLRTGSGWLRSVTSFTKMDNFGTSQCKKSEHSEPSYTEGAEIVIRTAAHVVFDEEEGQHTTCHFFFDEGGKPDDCKDVIVFNRAKKITMDIDGDWCDMTFVTHDKGLAEKLEKMISERLELHHKVCDRFPAEEYNEESKTKLNLVIIVSHPHGCRKHVSFGLFQDRKYESPCSKYTRYTYTTPTCPGSSGAPVIIFGSTRRFAFCSHPHSGVADIVNQLNYSGIGSN